MRARSLSLVAAALVCAASTPIASAKRNTAEPTVLTLPSTLRKSRSVGAPWKGKLTRGVRLEQSAELRYVGEYAPLNHFYGTWQLVQLLGRAAQYVNKKLPGARLSVGEMSAQNGGNLPNHASHESGRDVDVGFYMLDAAGRPYSAFAFANFDERGRGIKPNVGLKFDVARNWELVARLVTDGDARVQYVFVAPGLRWLLLEEGKRRGATPAVLDRAAHVMVAPNERHPHGNHFHVRIYCGPNERPQCTDSAPYWPWYPGTAPLAR